LIYLFTSRALRKEHPSIFPKRVAPIESDAYCRAFLNISFMVPSKWAIPPGPLGERWPVPRALLHSSLEVPSIQAPLLISGSPEHKDAPVERDARIWSVR
jgi:hypothetical protein